MQFVKKKVIQYDIIDILFRLDLKVWKYCELSKLNEFNKFSK